MTKLGALGLKEDLRNKGIMITMFDYGLKLIRDDGYLEAAAGPISIENAPMIKIIEKN